jgi:hypothetical protein
VTVAPALRFRQLDVSPEDPVEKWGVEGLATAIDRGGLQHWRRIAAAVRRDPDGPVLADLLEALEIAESPGVVATLTRVVQRIRGGEEYDVAQRVRAAIRRSSLTAAEFAGVIGTSGSRLSTYANGTVTPSAALLQRIESEARRRAVLRAPGVTLGAPRSSATT